MGCNHEEWDGDDWTYKSWVLVELPLGKDVVGTKWIYKMKYKSNGTIDKYIARLVEKGYTQ